MAVKFGPDKVVLPAGSSDPTGTREAGELFFNTTENAFKYHKGSGDWTKISAVIAVLNSVSGTITNGSTGSLTLTGEGFLLANATVKFSASGISDQTVSVTPTSDTSITVTIPSAVYGLSGGTTVTITVINSDNTESAGVTTTVAYPLGSSQNPATDATELANAGKSTGQYYIQPSGASTAYYCDVAINTGPSGRNANWVKIAGMGSGGYSGNNGLSTMPSGSLNTSYLSNNNHFNTQGYDFKVDDAWMNAFGATRMIVQSTAEGMVAEFNYSGSHVAIPNLRQYYFDVNNQQSFDSTVDNWLAANCQIWEGSDGPHRASVWNMNNQTNYHFGWSTQRGGNAHHMLHGSQNGGSYVGFCLGDTCWNQSAAIWLSVD